MRCCLPIDNISVEALAAYVAQLSRRRLSSPHVKRVEITIEESPGQGARAAVEL